jgi:DNA-binding NarL/FixJ family response regulator
MPVRVLIVDDHDVVRRGLRSFLELDPELQIVGEAADGAAAVRMACKFRPDVVLMDLQMPVMDGVAATSAIRKELQDTEVLALTNFLEEALVVRVIQAGAIGYLLKDINAMKLRQSIKAAARREVQLSTEAAAMLMKKIKVPDSPESLSARETEVLRLISRGLSNKEIADSLFISESTVKTHVRRILQKLNMPSRTAAALYAARMGLVTLALTEK